MLLKRTMFSLFISHKTLLATVVQLWCTAQRFPAFAQFPWAAERLDVRHVGVLSGPYLTRVPSFIGTRAVQ